VAEDEQHNSSEEAGGHFPFLHFQAPLDSAREIPARLNTQGIHSRRLQKILRQRIWKPSAVELPPKPVPRSIPSQLRFATFGEG
jgi:hypothetical protein